MEPYDVPTEDLLAHASFLEDLSYSLVGEESGANDLVQDTWLTAIERPPRHQSNLGAWLRAVARNLAIRKIRSKRRRVRRETAVARSESLPASDQINDRDETLQRVTRAVEALNDPYKTVVIMRFFDDLPPREISARLDRPVKTVKSQLHRGLEKLRASLRDEFGDDPSTWKIALASAFGWDMRAAGTTTASVGSAGLFSWMLNAKAVAILCLGIVAIGWMWKPFGAGDGVDLDALSSDKTEAASEKVAALSNENAPSIRERNESANALIPTIEGSDDRSASLAPLQLFITDQLDARVPGAQILVMDANGEFHKRGRADAEGRVQLDISKDDLNRPRTFIELKSPLPKMDDRIGLQAVADGHSPSDVYFVPPSADDRVVTIQIGPPGFTLRGRVTDPEGRGVRRATVSRQEVEKGRRVTDDGILLVNAPMTISADERGYYEALHVPKGLYWLQFGAHGFVSHWERLITVADDTVTLNIKLERGGTLMGYVRDMSGAPVAGARVWYRLVSNIHEEGAITDEAGRYRIDGIALGRKLFFRAQDGELVDRVARTLDGADIEEWNPILRPAPGVHLKLVDEAGQPYAGQQFQINTRSTRGASTAYLETNGAGKVSTYDYPPGVHHIEVFPMSPYGTKRVFPVASIEGFKPTSEFQTIVVPRNDVNYGGIVGELVDHAGKRFDEFAISVKGTRSDEWRRVRLRTGGTEIKNSALPPDRYEMLAQCGEDGCVIFEPFEVTAGETLDLGTLRAPAPGEVAIEWNYSEAAGYSFEVLNTAVANRRELKALWLANTGAGAPEERYSLLPGTYRLRVMKGRAVIDEISFDIASEEVTQLEANPLTAFQSEVQFTESDGAGSANHLRLQVFRLKNPNNPSSIVGSPVIEEELPRAEDGSFRHLLSLHEGAYLIIGRTADGREGSIHRTVSEGEDVARLEITLQ